MGSDLQCSRNAFLAVVNVFDVLILSGALFHNLAASHLKLFFAFVDIPTSVRSPQVRLLVVMAFSCLSLVFIFLGIVGHWKLSTFLSIWFVLQFD
jgi:hypothetical protein